MTYRVVGRALAIAAVALMALAAYWCARLAWADHLSRTGQHDRVARAASLSPGDADIHVRLADVTVSGGGDPRTALQAAVSLDPGNATAWIRLGLDAEIRGDLQTAELDLLRAARESRKYEPRWALANYYFRHGDETHFWPWAAESLRVAYGSLDPVFRLCWQVSRDPAAIFERAIPPRRPILRAYLGYLTTRNQLDAAQPVAEKLAGIASSDDRDELIGWCDREIVTGSAQAPVQVWNTLCSRRLLPFPALDPAGGHSLTDGTFQTEPRGGGFGWRLTPADGAFSGWDSAPPGLWFSFNGDQPESCQLLSQYLPVVAGSQYRLAFEYRTADIPAESGLRWRVTDVRAHHDASASRGWLSSPEWTEGKMEFSALKAPLAQLALTYQRLPGTTRIRGTLNLRRVSLEKLR